MLKKKISFNVFKKIQNLGALFSDINHSMRLDISLVIATLLLINSLSAEIVEKPPISQSQNELNHIVFIADGNRRWAKAQGLSPLDGHRVGLLETAPKILRKSWELNIHTATLWGFSTSNWNRSHDEIDNLMIRFEELIIKMLPIAREMNVRIIHLGRKDRIPEFLLKTINQAEKDTAHYSKHIFNFGIDYSGRDDLLRACQEIATKEIKAEDITEKTISDHIDTAHQPYQNPDLIIRTSGEIRLSGMMAWESTYAELYFTNEYFPAFNEELLSKAIENFYTRTRTSR